MEEAQKYLQVHRSQIQAQLDAIRAAQDSPYFRELRKALAAEGERQQDIFATVRAAASAMQSESFKRAQRQLALGILKARAETPRLSTPAAQVDGSLTGEATVSATA